MQDQNRSILFCTEIFAYNPLESLEEDQQAHRWAGPLIKAYSWQQAEDYCRLKKGYLSVTGIDGNERNTDDVIIDATGFEVPTPKAYQPVTNSEPEPQIAEDTACTPQDGCAMMIEEVEISLQEGDTVVLKSGGPLMTVGSVQHNWVGVKYFVGTDLMEFDLSPAQLTLINR